MAVELHVSGGPARVVVSPPPHSGRYWIEVRPAGGAAACGHRSPQALLWLVFLEADRETGREVMDVICSSCDPGRYRRWEGWAEALA